MLERAHPTQVTQSNEVTEEVSVHGIVDGFGEPVNNDAGVAMCLEEGNAVCHLGCHCLNDGRCLAAAFGTQDEEVSTSLLAGKDSSNELILSPIVDLDVGQLSLISTTRSS